MNNIQEVEQKFKNTEQILRNAEESFRKLLNSVFRLEYRKTFKPKRSEYIPTLKEFLDDPPKETETEFYEFFETFKYLYI